jgi:hypothetical protein
MTEDNQIPTINYTIKNDIEISHAVIKSLQKFCQDSVNNSVEGILLGHEDNLKIYIEQALPIAKKEEGIVDNIDHSLIVF